MSIGFVSASNCSSSDFTFTCRSFVKMLSSMGLHGIPVTNPHSPLTNTFWKPSNSQLLTYLICFLLIMYSASISDRVSCDITTNTVKSLDLFTSLWLPLSIKLESYQKSIIYVWEALFKTKKDRTTLMLTSINCMTVLQSSFNWIPLQFFMSLHLAYWYPVSTEISHQRSSLEYIRSPPGNEHSKI